MVPKKMDEGHWYNDNGLVILAADDGLGYRLDALYWVEHSEHFAEMLESGGVDLIPTKGDYTVNMRTICFSLFFFFQSIARY